MSHALEGVLRFLNLSATSVGAGATDCDLRPAAGCVWEVLNAVGTQDDGAVATKWLSTDLEAADQDMYISETAAAAWTQLPLYWYRAAYATPARPYVLTYDRYCTFQFTASAVGKHAYVKAIVIEHRGVAVEA